METAYLKTFLVVARLSSFSRAAEEILLSQPAVSKRISLLEQELGVKLFDRIGRSVRLTEAGQLFESRARDLDNEIDQTIYHMQSLQGQTGGTLSIGISHHLGLHRLPALLREFSIANPAVKLDIRFMDSEKAHEAVSRGDIELAAITLAELRTAKISSLRLWRDRLHFVCGTEHPLAKATSLSLAKLSAWPCCLPSMATYTGRIIQRCFEREGAVLQPVLTTNYMETLARMTEIGLGWSVLPQTLSESPLLIRLAVPAALSRDLGIIYNRERTRSRAAQAFLNFAEEFIETSRLSPPNL